MKILREPTRTKNQDRANAFDLDLFRLIIRADGHGCKDQTHRADDRAGWHPIEEKLREVRPLVRKMMHDADRKKTS